MRWPSSAPSRAARETGSRRCDVKLSGGFGSDACGLETRVKIAAAQRGERAHNWQGTQVGYSGIHKRARAALPAICALGDGTCRGGLEVALRRDATGPLREDHRGLYSPLVGDYWRLCRSHHNRYDGKEPPEITRTGRRKGAVARS